jgi:hypothetical protein
MKSDHGGVDAEEDCTDIKYELERPVGGGMVSGSSDLTDLSTNSTSKSGVNNRDREARSCRTLSSIPAEDIFHKDAITAENNKKNIGSSRDSCSDMCQNNISFTMFSQI